jgi:hypothetical protein
MNQINILLTGNPMVFEKKINPIASAFSSTFSSIGSVASQVTNQVKNSVDSCIKSANFKTQESLQPVINVINEANIALYDKNRTIQQSAMPNALAAALGAGTAGSVSFSSLYGMSMQQYSGTGINMAFNAAHSLISNGIGRTVLSTGGSVVSETVKNKQLKDDKSKIYQDVQGKQSAISAELSVEVTSAGKERLDYLQGLNLLLIQAEKDLREDLNIC